MSKRLPAEWEPQEAIQLTLPHKDTDWKDCLEEAQTCFNALVSVISQYQKMILVCPDILEAKAWLKDYHAPNTVFVEVMTNDTWARDHGAITIYDENTPVLLDFVFNGWGLKFPAHHDNQISRSLHQKNVFGRVPLITMPYVLEGGSIESDGEGTLMTTSECLLSYNRNPTLSKEAIEERLGDYFGVKQVLWLHHGHLEGDDTDAHIDTLARFCDPKTIAYVQCNDQKDVHYEELKKMEEELQAFRTIYGEPYQLVPLPMAPAMFDEDDGHRLPSTYANFLITNDLVLVPTYQAKEDDLVIEILESVFPDRKVIGIDCRVLVRQHGSLHCVTMQYGKLE